MIANGEGIYQSGPDQMFYTRLIAATSGIWELYQSIYGNHALSQKCFDQLIQLIIDAHRERPAQLKHRDEQKADAGNWFLSHRITGMSLYVDRFSDNLDSLREKLDYFEELGVNFLHLMPLFESPAGESDGGYAVSDFRAIDPRFGNIDSLRELQEEMRKRDMFLMLDIVLNHTSHKHAWAKKAREGEAAFQDYYYMFPDRSLPDAYERHLPEIFPESSPGNFTYLPECEKWVMTVFHNYQWDLNYTNPRVFLEMMELIFFYANLGVDILRIDAPAFIWKQLGTTCQNLPEAHTLLRLIKQCVTVGTPGMALLGEAIVAPHEIMKYFGTGHYVARECDFAYNATQMALQWDALATQDTRVMLAAQHEILQKPYGTSWITYTRCHDDIGLGYDDYMIRQAGYDPFLHRSFIKDYYAGQFPGSTARGALFSVNPKTNDARISGSLASLCGLETALISGNTEELENAIRKIILMQAQSFFLGGIPMIFYGDELGITNDYSYMDDPAKSYDNRWMHRPMIRWDLAANRFSQGTHTYRIFEATRQLIRIRRSLPILDDLKNLQWMDTHSKQVAGFVRTLEDERLFCLFNFSGQFQEIPVEIFKPFGPYTRSYWDHWRKVEIKNGDSAVLGKLEPYSFMLLQPRQP